MIDPTLACSGQAGILKPGSQQLVQVTSASVAGFVEALLVELGPAALIIAAIVGGTTYNALNVCSRPDPGDPGLTVDDIIEAGNPSTFAAYTQATARIYQWFEHVIWPYWCDCANGTAPPANPTPALPPGTINPSLPTGTLGSSCWDAQATLNQNQPDFWRLNNMLPLNGAMPGWPAGQGPAPQKLPLPLPTTVVISGTRNSTGGALAHFNGGIQFRDAAGAVTSGGGFGTDTPPGTPLTITAAVPSTAVYADVWFSAIASGQFTSDTFTGNVELLCVGDSTTAPVTPCCPPDPLLDARLAQILQYEKIIVQLLGKPLHSHVDGTRHTNLSGAGSIILVDQVDAIRVNVTSSLTNWPHNPGDPNYYLSLGFITSFAAGSPLKGWRLVYVAQTYPIVPYADQIGYTLPPGVTVDITELIQAP